MDENSTNDLAETVLFQQENRKQQLEDDIVALRQEKARSKTLFTKARRHLLVLKQEKDVTAQTIQNACDSGWGTSDSTMVSLAD